jgi:hypothetical protein
MSILRENRRCYPIRGIQPHSRLYVDDICAISCFLCFIDFVLVVCYANIYVIYVQNIWNQFILASGE